MPDGMAGAGMRRLKLETMDLHREAERHVRILDPDATDATYARFLARMFGFHCPIERAFARHEALSAAGFDPGSRRKQELLRADLSSLGIDASALPICADLPDVTTPARAVGVAYVVEGSTLGGPFILSRMRPRLGHLVGSASAFLEGYRAATGAMWRRFAAVAAVVIVDAGTGDAAVAAARETFEKLIEWLAEPARDPPHPARRRSEGRRTRSELGS